MTAPELGWDGHPADEQEPPPDFLEVLDGGPADAAPEKPTIQIRAGHLSDMIQATIRALGEGDHNLYQRSGQLVRIVREPERREPYELDQRQGMSILTRPGTPRLTDAAPILLEQADVAARWERFVPPRSKKEDAQGSWVAANPDPIVINQIAKRQDWPGIRPIRGLLETPCLAPSGRIIQAPGYDEETAHVLLPSCGIGSLIEVPTQANARAALKYLWTEIACDFPFRGIGEPARDGAVGQRRFGLFVRLEQICPALLVLHAFDHRVGELQLVAHILHGRPGLFVATLGRPFLAVERDGHATGRGASRLDHRDGFTHRGSR